MQHKEDGEARRWALFAPVILGLGVAAYFELGEEPSFRLGAAAGLCAVGAAMLWSRLFATRVVLWGVALLALGFAAAQFRAHSVAAPVWAERGEVSFTGRAATLEQSADGSARLLIADVDIPTSDASRTPQKIRVSLRRLGANLPIEDVRAKLRPLVGRRIAASARLFAPPGPAEPGAFDYRRRAWFEGVGALGTATEWPRDLGPAQIDQPLEAISAEVDALRRMIAERARAGAPGVGGEVAAALLVGDRSGVPPEALEALRGSNLAHLLAISGLHMGILCATAFAVLRILFALPAAPPFGVAPKKLAAGAALVVGAIYLLMAGGAVPTQRAYIMAAVIFGAVLFDRPPITLRAVALAAIIILLARPESLYDAGFQLSFAATTVMVAVFEAAGGHIRRRRVRLADRGVISNWGPQFVSAAVGLLVASLVAGLATAPFAAHAFNRLAPYGLLANLLAVPALGLWIMPLGLAALALVPFGFDAPAFALMGLGVDYVLTIAQWVASMPGALAPVKAGSSIALTLIALGGLGLCLWRGRALRIFGAAVILAGMVVWRLAPRPDVLIADRGGRVGVLTGDGRAFDRKASGNYAAELWLRRDGDLPENADRRRAFLRFDGGAVARSTDGLRVEITLSPTPDLELLCAGPGVVIAPKAQGVSAAPREDCIVYDRTRLRSSGAVAISTRGAEIDKITRASDVAGKRLWTDAATRRRLLAPPPKSD